MKTILTFIAATAMAATLTASAQELPENLYLIGDATQAGWNCNAPEKMVKVNDYEFSYTGNFTTGEFKLPWVVGGDMWSSNTYMPLEAGEKVTKTGLSGSESYLTHNGQPDQKWVVADAGVYEITFRIDKDDTNFGTLSARWVSELPSCIYMLGAATGQWDSNSGTPIYGENRKYEWTGALDYYNDDKLVKIALTRGNWDEVTFAVPTEVDYNGNVLQIVAGTYPYMESAETEPGALKDWFWGVKEGGSGEYRITVDTDAKTISFELLKSYTFDKDNITELYMLGLAADSFDSNHPLPMTALGEGRFSWTGEIDYATEDGDGTHSNKQFKFVTPTGDWNKVYYLVPVAAEADGYIQEVVAGSYPVKMSTWTEGRTGVDAFFGLASGMKGRYTVTVNVPEMTVTLADGETSVETVSADGFRVELRGEALTVDGEAEIYDIEGIKVAATCCGKADLSELATGVYVVSSAKGSVKIYKK